MNISNPDYDQLANRIKLLAHPERLRILDALRGHAQCVCHLEALLQRPQPYVSQQVRMLSRAGVLESERQGTNIYYYVSDAELLAWLEALLGPAAAADGHHFVDNCPCPKCAVVLLPTPIQLVID